MSSTDEIQVGHKSSLHMSAILPGEIRSQRVCEVAAFSGRDSIDQQRQVQQSFLLQGSRVEPDFQIEFVVREEGLFGTSALQSSMAKPRLVIGTLGDDGHGKTTVIAAITKLLGAGSPREVNSGWIPSKGAPSVTVVEYETARRHYVHYDCKSYDDYAKYLITGAEHLDGGIVVASAKKGVTHRSCDVPAQLDVARYVGVSSLVCFLDNGDLVEDKEVEEVENDLRELLQETEFPGDKVPVVRGSALLALEGDPKGEASIRKLLEAMDEYIPDPIANKPFLMLVEHVESIQGQGVRVTGGVERGVIKEGEEVEILGPRSNAARTVTVEGVEMDAHHNKEGHQVSLILREMLKADVQHGQIICKAKTVSLHEKFDAEILLFKTEEGGPDTYITPDYEACLLFRNAEARGSVLFFDDTSEVCPGEHKPAEFELQEPCPIEVGQRFFLREGNKTVGVGVVFSLLI